MKKPIVVSAVQPTGNLHLGNYLGAVANWRELQDSGKYSLFIFIADYHSLTLGLPAEQLRAQIATTAAELLALGIDPKETTLFVQSHVPYHTELAWIFDTVTPVAELERMTQYKDKSARQAQNINAGLFTYPVLQAADILLYHGALVPVGQDQIQHVELTRDIARFFNKRYGEYFPETKPLLTQIPKVMSLLEPEKKMSKSLGAGHVIELADSPEVIEAKLKKAVTATSGGEKSPGVENLLLLLEKFVGAAEVQPFRDAEQDGSIRYSELKEALAEAIATHFTSFRMRRAELLEDPLELARILTSGAKKANRIAEGTTEEVRRLVGVR